MRVASRLLSLLVLAVLLAACGSSGPDFDAPTPGKLSTAMPSGHHIKTVFLIVMENHNWSDIAGSSHAPYINGTLLKQATYATQYYNPPGNHPSLPNYI